MGCLRPARPGGAAILVAAVLGGACVRPAQQETIRIAHEADALSLDPLTVAEAATHSILSNLFEGLVAFDAEMRLVPALAVQWNSLDERTWQIELRPGVRFHDGHVFDADDVKYTLDRARSDPDSGVRGHLATLSGVQVLSPTRVRLVTTQPDPLLMNRMTYVLVVHAPDPGSGPGVPVGTGPYRFVSWQPGRQLDLAAFPEYWGGAPSFAKARFVPVAEGYDSLRVLKDQQVDVLRYLPESYSGELQGRGVRVLERAGLTSYYLWLRSQAARGERQPLSDRRVRRALSLAIDRPKIVQSLGGRGAPAAQLVQTGVFGHVTGLPPLGHDPEQARALLREAGYAAGFEVTLVHRAQASQTLVARLIRDQLGVVGIQVGLEAPDWPDVVQSVRRGGLPFFLMGWRFENGDAASFLRDCLMSRDAARGAGHFNPGYSNPALDRLIEDNAQMFGETARLAQYAEMMKLVLDEMPLVPLYHRANLYGVSERVSWSPRLDGKLLAAEMKPN